MKFLFKKLLPLIASLLTLVSVLFLVEAPNSWAEASWWQILAFFIPLYFLILSLIHLIIKNKTFSLLLSMLIFLLLTIRAANKLNFFAFIAIIICFITLIYILRRSQQKTFYFLKPLHKQLTQDTQIPKLRAIRRKEDE